MHGTELLANEEQVALVADLGGAPSSSHSLSNGASADATTASRSVGGGGDGLHPAAVATKARSAQARGEAFAPMLAIVPAIARSTLLPFW